MGVSEPYIGYTIYVRYLLEIISPLFDNLKTSNYFMKDNQWIKSVSYLHVLITYHVYALFKQYISDCEFNYFYEYIKISEVIYSKYIPPRIILVVTNARAELEL